MVTTLGTAMKELYPELISCAGNFPEAMTFDIGFINPDIENWQGDDIANDETEFTAEGLEELEALYEDFCRENNFPTDTVTYVEVSEPEGKTTKKIYRVWAECISDCYLDVEASSEEEARSMAAERDGGEFTACDSGSFSITDVYEID